MTTPSRGARVYVELDEELTKVLDLARQDVRLTRINFIRWILARHLLGTGSLQALTPEASR